MGRAKSPKRNLVVIAVMLNTKRQVLLTRRDQPKSIHAHEKWQFPGGGIEHGEHPLDTLHREIREELGDIKYITLSERPIVYSNFYPETSTHAILLGFPVQYISGKIDISGDNEADDARWFDLDQIESADCLPGISDLTSHALQFLKI